MCNREEPRPGEAVARVLLKPVAFLFPTAITTPVEILSRAMINNVVSQSQDKFQLFENKAIHQMAGSPSACSKDLSSETTKAKW